MASGGVPENEACGSRRNLFTTTLKNNKNKQRERVEVGGRVTSKGEVSKLPTVFNIDITLTMFTIDDICIFHTIASRHISLSLNVSLALPVCYLLTFKRLN